MLTGDTLNRSVQNIGLCVMPEGEKIQAVKGENDDTENSARVRSVRSSPRTVTPFTWRRNAVYVTSKSKMKGRRNLNETDIGNFGTNEM